MGQVGAVCSNLRGDFTHLSERKLMDCRNRLGNDIEIRVTPARNVKHKIRSIRSRMKELATLEEQIRNSPDGQISPTDPDARCIATSDKGKAMVGYNVQTAVDTKHHLIFAHEVTNLGHDRIMLSAMAQKAREAIGLKKLKVLADRGYFSGPKILDCDEHRLPQKALRLFIVASGRDGRGFLRPASDVDREQEILGGLTVLEGRPTIAPR